MVDSATLARLIDHADRAEAKLVLVGDPQQLGEIEAGGLFAALAERTDPIYLDEVIRHRHDLDREAAKRIREGEGGEALSLYRSSERVIVAPDAESRREAMVSDWHQAFDRGEDAVMIAKRNVEVERLNELAREVRKQAGKLGAAEIEVGEASFAPGDQVITRVNDRQHHIYNRERWRIAEVDVEAHSVVLDGIDTRRRVCVDAVYLERVNPYNEAPASLKRRRGIGRRLRRMTWQLQALPTAELIERRNSLGPAAGWEASNQREREDLQRRIESKAEFLRGIDAQRERAEELPRRMRRPEHERIDRTEATARQALARTEAQAAELPTPGQSAREELAAVEQLLAERRALAVTVAHLAPPNYITKELGERPSAPTERNTWERGVEGIERYRQENGVTDKSHALGVESKGGAERARRNNELRRLRQVQRELGLEAGLSRSRELGRGMGIGR
jgi:hypothetical protein